MRRAGRAPAAGGLLTTLGLLLALGIVACGDDAADDAVWTFDAAPSDGGSPFDAAASRDAAGPRDGGAPPDSGRPEASAEAGAPTAPCLELVPVSPGRFSDLVAGESATLAVEGRARLPAEDAGTGWTWSVVDADGNAVPHTAVVGAPHLVQVPLRRAGRYVIRAELGACRATQAIQVVPPSTTQGALYWVRVTPAPGQTWPAQETTVLVPPGAEVERSLTLAPGYEVRIEPERRQNGRRELVFGYVRIAAPGSALRLEGRAEAAGFAGALTPDRAYDVLVIPDDVGLAPALFRRLGALSLGREAFSIDPGVGVQGTVTAADRPLPGATVLLRAGDLPSTLGTTSGEGGFALRARGGRHRAIVLPPRDRGLPEAHLDADLEVPDAGPVRLSFAYAPLPAVRLDVAVRDPEGRPLAAEALVRLESRPGGLGAAVGVFETEAGPRPATGRLLLERTSASGAASFGEIPRGRYLLTVVPDPTSTAAATRRELDLTGGDGLRTVTLDRRVRLTGRLRADLPLAGVRVVASDASAAAGPRLGEISAEVGADGSYTLLVHPDRSYRLLAEPPAGSPLPRTPLGLEPVQAADRQIAERRLARAVTLVGAVVAPSAAAVRGAVVQIYCLGENVDYCVSPTTPNTESARPLAEATVPADGRVRLRLPDPAASLF